ncbi:uncharacterized protein METZ01_LOCUS198524, partial [marine metagenome]
MVNRRKLKKSKKSAQITIENNSYDFPIYESTIGENVIDNFSVAVLPVKY